jgi:hypothetical protein
VDRRLRRRTLSWPWKKWRPSCWPTSTLLHFPPYRAPNVVNQINDLEGDFRHIQKYPVETMILYRELLIGVNSFFREPDAMNELMENRLHSLIANTKNREIRFWLTDCFETLMRNDVDNLLSSSGIEVLILDENYEIRKYSPVITRIFHILEKDAAPDFHEDDKPFQAVTLLGDITEQVKARLRPGGH